VSRTKGTRVDRVQYASDNKKSWYGTINGTPWQAFETGRGVVLANKGAALTEQEREVVLLAVTDYEAGIARRIRSAMEGQD
jgi:hypothetical protein